MKYLIQQPNKNLSMIRLRVEDVNNRMQVDKSTKFPARHRKDATTPSLDPLGSLT